jgi:transcriptional regulator with XRE-family HTH domain
VIVFAEEGIMLPDDIAIGQKIHRRRGDFGYSLRDLAKKSGLTASHLSQIERGNASPSLNSLRKIAECLEVPILFFLSDTSKRSLVVRADARPQVDLDKSSVRIQMLTPNIEHKMEPLIVTMEPRCGYETRLLSVPTEEFIYVLTGCLEVIIENEKYVLNPGDSMYFEGVGLKNLSCASEEKVTWVSVITPPVF